MKSKLLTWYHTDFKDTKLYFDMVSTVEDSKYHREANVGIHTDMVVSEYISRCPEIWNRNHVIGFLVSVFHDVGKPSSEITKYSDERGVYRVYYNHNLVSSRLWEDYIMENLNLLDDIFEIPFHDIYGITWMIEHHLPWKIKNHSKLKDYVYTVRNILDNGYTDIYGHVLLSDSVGRVTDDTENNLVEATKWVSDFNSLIRLDYRDSVVYKDKILYMPIAASGTGKSTFTKKFKDNIKIHSLDDFRELEYPSDDYLSSYFLAEADPEFFKKANAEYIKLLDSGENVLVDNTNLSKKTRNHYIIEARKRGYELIAVVFPISLKQLTEQQVNRTDKIIGEDVYVPMYNRLQQPSYNTFNRVIVYDRRIGCN